MAELRRRIAAHEVAPGAHLKEHDLAAELGVSRARIREALANLESRGLVERIPNKGAVVAQLDLDQVYAVYDVREVLEGLCVRLAVANTDPAGWQDLVDTFEEPMGRHVDDGDFDAFIAGYELFRRRVQEAADNPVLSDMLDSIYEKTAVIIRRIIILPGRAPVGLAEHRAVLAAMRAGDAEEAERLRRHNMRSAKSWLQRYERFVF